MRGFITQLAERRTGIAVVTGLNHVEALNFFLCDFLNFKHNCEDFTSNSTRSPFIISIIFDILNNEDYILPRWVPNQSWHCHTGPSYQRNSVSTNKETQEFWSNNTSRRETPCLTIQSHANQQSFCLSINVVHSLLSNSQTKPLRIRVN